MEKIIFILKNLSLKNNKKQNSQRIRNKNQRISNRFNTVTYQLIILILVLMMEWVLEI
jgi:hypothetical protein